jgi:hypothetical protein
MNFTHIKGDTFDEVAFSIKINNVDLDLTGATIKMQLKRPADLTVTILSLTSVASAGITITNPSGGLFKINEQIIDIEVFNYAYDIQLTLASGVVKTYVSGTFNITKEITT